MSKKSSNWTTDFSDKESYVTDIKKKLNFDNMYDLIYVLFDSIENFHSKHRRIINLIIYLLLRLVSIQYNECKIILDQLNLLNLRNCHSWLLTIIDEDDSCVVLRDKRGS